MNLLFGIACSFTVNCYADTPSTSTSAPVRWYQQVKSLAQGLWIKDADDWLAEIGSALREQNYQGTLVMISADRMETLQVFHAFDQGHERMRLVALSGPRREVIRDDKMVMCIGTGLLPVGYDADTTGRWNPAAEFANAGRLNAYRPKLGPVERVAGRDAQVIELHARDSWRYGYRLWLDKETALPLQVALLDDSGRPLERMAFTELKLGVAPDPVDLLPSTQKGLQRIQTLRPGQQIDPGWRVNSVPPGYRLQAARHLGDAVQLLYSDGLANVSVYIEPMLAGARGESAMQRGAVNVRSIWQDGRRVVAIGKVPVATVEHFMRNVQAPRAARIKND